MKQQIEKIDWYAVKQNLELEPMIRLWIKFKNLPATTQQRVWDEYNEYYGKVKESPIAKNFFDMRNGDVQAKRQLNKDLVEMGLTVRKPSSFEIDPMAFFHDEQVYQYRKAIEEIGREKEARKLSF